MMLRIVRREMHLWFWWENPNERLSGRRKHNWEDGIKMDLKSSRIGGHELASAGS
jgi:hypothetical protein